VWKPVAWLLWDHDAQRLRVWASEPALPTDELSTLHAAMMNGIPFGWLTDTTGFAVQDEQAPMHEPTDRQLLGIPPTVDLTGDLIRDKQRAACWAIEKAANALRKHLPTVKAQMRANPDLDAVVDP